MAFRFSLAALLRLRATLEQVEERGLLRLRQDTRQLEILLEQMAVRQHSQKVRRIAPPAGAVLTGAHLQFSDFLETRLKHEEQLAREQLRVKIEEVRKQFAIFAEARRRREAIEALRDHELRTFQEQDRRREQRSLDDVFLLQLLLARRGRRG